MEDMSAMDYEILVRRAFQCGRNGTKSADADIFRGLILDEYNYHQNLNDKRNQTQYKDNLQKVKDSVIDALKQGLNRLKDDTKSDKILDHILKTENSSNVQELAEVIREALDTFIELEIEM